MAGLDETEIGNKLSQPKFEFISLARIGRMGEPLSFIYENKLGHCDRITGLFHLSWSNENRNPLIFR